MVVHLKLLFYLIISHEVPDKFGSGVIVPLVKDRAADLNDMVNYRGITLVPIISKVFESFMLSVCRDVLRTDPLQFGFTSGVGCSEAIFALKSTINHFIQNGSCVYSAFSALTLLVGRQEGHPACKKLEWWGTGVVICLERDADLHIC